MVNGASAPGVRAEQPPINAAEIAAKLDWKLSSQIENTPAPGGELSSISSSMCIGCTAVARRPATRPGLMPNSEVYSGSDLSSNTRGTCG